MLKKHSEFFKNLLFMSDVLIICACWIVSYYLRFSTNLAAAATARVPLSTYAWLLIAVVLVWSFVFRAFDLYKPRRLASHFREILDIAKAFTVALLVFIAVSYLLRRFELSRLSFLYFWVLSIAALALSRSLFRGSLRLMRKKGYNLRHGLIVGSGTAASDLLEKIAHHPELGVRIIGSLRNDVPPDGERPIPVLGTYEELTRVLEQWTVDIVFITLANDEQACLESILGQLSNELVEVKVIPDLFRFVTLWGGIDDIEGLPIISLQGTPLYGWNRVFKRCFDIVFSSFAIVVFSPVMLLIACLIRLTSPGPIFYVQERMGLDGRTFRMVKFRSMRVDAEKDTGPVWAQSEDPRRTWIGSFLRKTNLDELPQLFNVWGGHMSVVGPRPERAKFVEDFRKVVPGYMLRHKMKAGMTGWAQVNGLRGNTSIEDRIKYDLFYINHWSLSFDIKILVRTVWSGFRNAY